MRTYLLTFVACLAASATAAAANLVIAENGKTDYRIVIPDRSAGEIVDHWLLISAKLMQAAFERNGFKIEVVKEDPASRGKPGIYLGATVFAKQHGLQTSIREISPGRLLYVCDAPKRNALYVDFERVK